MITTDCHIAPPFSVFDDLPESYREWFPRLEHRDDGDYLVNPKTRAMGMGGMVQPPAINLEGSFPYSAEWNDKQFAGVPEDEVDAIVRGNAAKLFNITVD